jgi:uncharacterized protein YnzC (UPF0291/DUF896 family)
MKQQRKLTRSDKKRKHGNRKNYLEAKRKKGAQELNDLTPVEELKDAGMV